MSKGSKQRKPQVPDSQVNANWETIFSNNKKELTSAYADYIQSLQDKQSERINRNKK